MRLSFSLLLLTLGATDVCVGLSTQTLSSSPPKLGRLSPGGGDMDGFRKSYQTASECPPTVLEAPGIPKDFPSGTYFRNGGARFEAEDGTKVLHPFDADGMIHAVSFDGSGRVLYRNKFIETEGYLKDKETKTMSQAGVFGTRRSGGFLANIFQTNFKNIANTNVVYCPETKDLYALWEAGLPHRLDPITLKCKQKGECNLNGVLKPKENFAAHPRYDPKSNTWLNFGVGDPDPVSGATQVKFWELNADNFKVISRPTSITLPGVCVMHDFLATKDYLIMSWNKAEINSQVALKALLGLSSFVETIDFESSPETTIILIPRSVLRKGGQLTVDSPNVEKIPVPYNFNFHFGNAYQDPSDDSLVFDLVRSTDDEIVFSDQMGSNDKPVWEIIDPNSLKPSAFARYRLDVKGNRLIEPPTLLCSRSPEFPSVPTDISTQPHRYTYMVGAHEEGGWSFPGSICKVDAQEKGTECYTFEPQEICSEPALVRKVNASGAEDAAYLLTYVSDPYTSTSDLVIFDVEGNGSLEKGPVSRIRLPNYVPSGGLHGRFFESATFEF